MHLVVDNMARLLLEPAYRKADMERRSGKTSTCKWSLTERLWRLSRGSGPLFFFPYRRFYHLADHTLDIKAMLSCRPVAQIVATTRGDKSVRNRIRLYSCSQATCCASRRRSGTTVYTALACVRRSTCRR